MMRALSFFSKDARTLQAGRLKPITFRGEESLC